jgi:hypothetical protein
MGRFVLAVLVMFAGSLALYACGTTLDSLDTQSIQDLQKSNEFIAIRAASIEAGQIQILAEQNVCGAGGVLRRAGKPYDEAGVCK